MNLKWKGCKFVLIFRTLDNWKTLWGLDNSGLTPKRVIFLAAPQHLDVSLQNHTGTCQYWIEPGGDRRLQDLLLVVWNGASAFPLWLTCSTRNAGHFSSTDTGSHQSWPNAIKAQGPHYRNASLLNLLSLHSIGCWKKVVLPCKTHWYAGPFLWDGHFWSAVDLERKFSHL